MATERAAALQAHFSSPDQELQPILTSLNGDNSWLISFPRPAAERQSSGKAYFHAVHDPWLFGSTSLISTLLVHINLAAPASVTDGAGVEAVVQEIEKAAATAGGNVPSKVAAIDETKPFVDAIFVNLEEIDHLHEPTLRSFNNKIPVFAAQKASAIIQKWGYFDKVVTYNDLKPAVGDWKTLHPGVPLPEWLTIFRMQGHNFLSLATAMVWSVDAGKHEALLYSPHGIDINQPTMKTLLHEATPDISVLAILHGLKESSTWGWKNTFGVSYGLPLYRETKAKYWVLSHNSPFKYSGLVMQGVKDVQRTLEWGLGKEIDEGGSKLERESVNFVQVENGSFAVLS
jgi:hypothetical protein